MRLLSLLNLALLTLLLLSGATALTAHARLIAPMARPNRAPDPELLKRADVIITGNITGIRAETVSPTRSLPVSDVDDFVRPVRTAILTVAVERTLKGKCPAVAEIEVWYEKPEEAIFTMTPIHANQVLTRRDELLSRRLFLLREVNGKLSLVDPRRSELPLSLINTDKINSLTDLIERHVTYVLRAGPVGYSTFDLAAAMDAAVNFRFNKKETLDALEALMKHNAYGRTPEIELMVLLTQEKLGVTGSRERIVALLCNRLKNNAFGLNKDSIVKITEPYLEEAIRTKTDVTRFLNSSDFWVHRRVLDFMSGHQSPVFIPTYGESLFHDDPDVVLASMRGLRELKACPDDLTIPGFDRSKDETLPAATLFQWQRWWKAEGTNVIAKHLPDYQRKLDMAD